VAKHSLCRHHPRCEPYTLVGLVRICPGGRGVTCVPTGIHVVFTPKYRKKLLFGQIRRSSISERRPTPLGYVFRELARRKECQVEEGHLMPDHVHLLISIPPKYSVAEVIGYLKGKSSIWIAQNIERKLRNFLGHKFWAGGYFVSTVGRDEEMIRSYIKNQEMADIALGKARERRIRDESLKPLNEVQPVKIRSGQSSSKQAGSECCLSLGNWRVRSVHSKQAGREDFSSEIVCHLDADAGV
jgi:putative transposase